MSKPIEELLTEVKEALDRNTAALEKAAGVTGTQAATGGEKAGKTEKAPKADKKDEPKVTQDQVNAALIKLKDDFSMDEAKAIIKEHGKVEKMSEIKPATYQAVYDAAVARHAELSAGSGGGDL